MLGAAALGGGTEVTGEAIDRIIKDFASGWPRPPAMPRHVVSVVTPEAVVLFVHSHHAPAGQQAAVYRSGEFKAHASRYPFTIDLTIVPTDGQTIVLSGKRGPRHGVAGVTRAVLAMAALSRAKR